MTAAKQHTDIQAICCLFRKRKFTAVWATRGALYSTVRPIFDSTKYIKKHSLEMKEVSMKRSHTSFSKRGKWNQIRNLDHEIFELYDHEGCSDIHVFFIRNQDQAIVLKVS